MNQARNPIYVALQYSVGELPAAPTDWNSMRNLGDTVARLKSKTRSSFATGNLLEPVAIPGLNPGRLKAWKYVPDTLPNNPALVVVLHGCTQTAAAYDAGSGWSMLADRHGFVVLYPEQQRANNPGLCFNWYAPEDTRRDRGEAASIRAAIAAILRDHNIDRTRVFVTGLSAGGAMTSAMLATYPEVFAGGAILAGLPFGSAASMPEAFDRMRGHGLPTASAAIAAVLTASGHPGPWPSVSVWQGSADYTVAPANADALIAQWAGVHDLDLLDHETNAIAGHAHRVWRDASGEPVLEEYRIEGMGHGVPIDTRGVEPCGKPGPYMLEAGLSSTERLVTHWKLDAKTPAPRVSRPNDLPSRSYAPSPNSEASGHQPSVPRVQLIIEDALRRAGLMP